MFEGITNALKSKTVPHVAIEGRDQVTKLEYIDGAENQPNIVFNSYDLLGYEKRSDTTEIFDDEKYKGRGYFADIAGITVNLDRVPGEPEKYKPDETEPKIPKIPGALVIVGHGIAEKINPEWKEQVFTLVPCALLTGVNKIEEIRFRYLRLLPTGYLIDDKADRRYKVPEEIPRIDITMPDGKPGRGYVLDVETGFAITLYRRVKVFAVDENGEIVLDKEGKKVEVGINFASIIGHQATAEKLTSLLSIISGRERMVAMGTGFLIGQVLFMVFRI
jgi:hypothetical protein